MVKYVFQVRQAGRYCNLKVTVGTMLLSLGVGRQKVDRED